MVLILLVLNVLTLASGAVVASPALYLSQDIFTAGHGDLCIVQKEHWEQGGTYSQDDCGEGVEEGRVLNTVGDYITPTQTLL